MSPQSSQLLMVESVAGVEVIPAKGTAMISELSLAHLSSSESADTHRETTTTKQRLGRKFSGHGTAPQHPIIVPRVVDVVNGRQHVEVNPDPLAPFYNFESDRFRGQVVFKLRTDPVDETYAPYFAHKKRMFEIQVQGEILPHDGEAIIDTSRVFIGIETPEPVRMGGLTKLMASVIRKFIHRMNPHASTSFGETSRSSSVCEGF